MALFPPPDKDGQIKFIIAKSLPYKPRMALIAGLLLAGLGLEVGFSFWAGLAVLLAASLFGMVQGYDATPRIAGVEKWERVTPDEYTKIKLKADQLKRWDEDMFDITNTTGALVFVAGVILCVGIYLVLAGTFGFPVGYCNLVGLNAAVLIAPLWFTGVKEYLRKDRLIIKINLLEGVMRALTPLSEVQVFPMLALAETSEGKQDPEDARLLINLVGAPAAFYGVQVQISINGVKGQDFPYLYCVLIAKAGSGLLEGYERFLDKPSESSGMISDFFMRLVDPGQKLVYEAQKNPDADILVIRQLAEKNRGYSTGQKEADAIISASLEMAKKLIGGKGPDAVS